MTNVAVEGAYFVCLLGPMENDVMEAVEMIESLRHFEDEGRTPLIAFHEQDQPAARLAMLQRIAARERRPLRYARVDFSRTPSFAQRQKSHSFNLMFTHNRSGWSYMHIINFFFRGMLHHPALREARFVLRMDADSRLVRSPFALRDTRCCPHKRAPCLCACTRAPSF